MSSFPVSWSAFLREPTSIESKLERGDVLLRRRDGEPLYLSRASRRDDEREAVLTAVRLLNDRFAAPHEQAMDELVSARLPWTRVLSREDREAFGKEFLDHLGACAELGNFAPLSVLLTEWKNTASALLEGHREALTRPLEDVGPSIPRP